MWVKICGTTSSADAEAAVEAGADALGFIFAPSPRQVSIAQTAAITRGLPSQIEKYGVFVNPTFDYVVKVVQESGLTGVQLHMSHEPDLKQRLRSFFESEPGFKLLEVVHLGTEDTLTPEALEPFRTSCDGVLIDSRVGQLAGGTGVSFDWVSARTAFTSAADMRLIAAGGLSPENIAEAVATLRPWGVDVVSGVELSPGRKDPRRVAEFVQRAREAAAYSSTTAAL